MSNPYISLLDLWFLGGLIIYSKDIQQYLGFIFDKKLTFHQYIHYYAHKALSMIKGMKIIGNSSRGLFFIHKRLLYKICVFSIMLYGSQLWYTFISVSQRAEENLEKSSVMDHRSIPHVTNLESWGYSWSYFHLFSPQQNHWAILFIGDISF